MLEINNLRKNFNNQTQALKGVSLKIKKGEFISILGPSGSGKTTLLRSLNGLESIDSGEVIFDNNKITKENLPEVREKTGMIFQEFNLVNNISSINNVLTGLLNTSSKFLSMFYLFTKEQKLPVLVSSNGASTSSITQNGEGFNLNNANISDIAVNAFSPPDKRLIVVFFLPGGCADTWRPVSKISSPIN